MIVAVKPILSQLFTLDFRDKVYTFYADVFTVVTHVMGQ